MSKSIGFLEKFFVVYSFVAISGALNLIFLGAPETHPDHEVTTSYVLAKYPILLFGIFYIGRRLFAILSLAKSEWMLWFFCFYLYTSIIWNPAPNPPVKLLFTNLYYLLFAFYLLLRFDSKMRISLGFVYAIIISYGSIIMSSLCPDVSVVDDGTDTWWRGMFEDRNFGAMYICIGLAFSIAQFYYVRTYRLLALLTICAAAFFIFRSHSGTGRLCFIAMLSVSFFLSYFHKSKNTSLLILVGFLAVIMLIIGGVVFWNMKGLIFELLGKDATLTGRTDIWNGVFLAYQKAPWVGHGFGNSNVSIGGQVFRDRLVNEKDAITIQPAHNLLLSVLLQFGAIGLLVFIMLFMKIIGTALSSFYRLPYWLNILLLIVILIFSISLTLDTDPVVWICYVLILSAPKVDGILKKEKSSA